GPTPSSRKLGCSLFTRPGRQRDTPDEEQLPTGEPYAGKPPVRFGGRGGRQPFPTPIVDHGGCSAIDAGNRQELPRIEARAADEGPIHGGNAHKLLGVGWLYPT